ncbi:LysR family transcriptional regulator [Ancylobacter polymorphus]|uniref:LysR family transcriptional regulator n=1 Tax=Ancylobacter polymorphus TaxID=223390 RepID=A0A9E7A9I2_9HYPH|nr:LysR family transcriptional regulator [Ancylobacter polymorphus]UOK73279.1 LysR family transcriptional regulator [Ancylobacter polymorphus]
MQRDDLGDLQAFLVVAEESSFTRAAAKLGVSQPALSYTIRQLEARLGVRLLARTTRSVAPTEAGDRLLQTIGPHFEGIIAGMNALGEYRVKPAGTIRLTADEHAVRSIIAPALERILPAYPDIKVEITIDYGLTDIVAQRIDAGIRLGEHVAKDMIAVPVGPEMRMVVVGAPSYFDTRPGPLKPQDLITHNCINIRLPTYGGLYAWEFEKDGRELKVRVDGQLVYNSSGPMLDAVLSGLGLAFLPEDRAAPFIADGRLIQVLADWCSPFPGYHLYYPSRREPSSAFSVLVEAMRYRG